MISVKTKAVKSIFGILLRLIDGIFHILNNIWRPYIEINIFWKVMVFTETITKQKEN